MCGTLKKHPAISHQYIQIFTASHVMVVVTNVPYIYYYKMSKNYMNLDIFLDVMLFVGCV